MVDVEHHIPVKLRRLPTRRVLGREITGDDLSTEVDDQRARTGVRIGRVYPAEDRR